MTADQIFEEIRNLLREPIEDTDLDPWQYQDEDFVPQIQSALRYLRVVGLGITADMDADGVVLPEDFTEMEGLLIAYRVAESLLMGDLVQKLKDGELGITYRAGSDLIDTKGAARTFEEAAKKYQSDFRILITIALSTGTAGDAFFGGPEPYRA